MLQTSEDSGALAGEETAGTGLSGPGPGRGRTIDWFGGQRRFAVEVAVPGSEHRLVAAVPPSVLTAGAEDQLRRNVTLGAVASLLLAGLGLLLHRRLARPMRRITSAIGPPAAAATTCGPRSRGRVSWGRWPRRSTRCWPSGGAGKPTSATGRPTTPSPAC